VQVVEVDHVVLHVLRAEHQVADQLGVVGDGDLQRVLDTANAGQCVHRGAHAAGTLGEGPGVTGVPAPQDLLETAHHGARAVGVGNHTVFHGGLDTQVPLDTRDRIDDDACHQP
jgi:hypothetical protein